METANLQTFCIRLPSSGLFGSSGNDPGQIPDVDAYFNSMLADGPDSILRRPAA